MCVIMAFDDQFPTDEILKNASAMNGDGGGLAYIKDGKVHWEKGMHVTGEYIQECIKQESIQLPIIVHFRIATHGGVNSELCHPFAISAEDGEDLADAGYDEAGVLFHNGIWHHYNDVALKVLLSNKGVRLPNGDLSDSRIMAWCVRFFGMNYLQLIDEKVLVLTPQGIVRYGKGWSTVDKVACSNDHFDKSWNKNRGNYNSRGSYNSSSPSTNSCVTINAGGSEDFQKSPHDLVRTKGAINQNQRNKESVNEGESVTLSSENKYQGNSEEYRQLFEDNEREIRMSPEILGQRINLNTELANSSAMQANDGSGVDLDEYLDENGWTDERGIYHYFDDEVYYP